MKKFNKVLFVSLLLITNLFVITAQNHPVNWLNNSNFDISVDGNTITHNQQSNTAHLLSAHYLDFNQDGYVELSNLEDLKDFSVFLESEDKLGNLSKDYGLLFNHILDTSGGTNQELDSIIALQYSKYKLTAVVSKDGTKQLKTRDFKILEHGKLIAELDNPKAPIAIPFSFAKTISIEKIGNQLFIKKNGAIIKTFNNIPQAKYRIGIHSYTNNTEQINQLSTTTSFNQLGSLNGTKDVAPTPPLPCINTQIDLDHNWTSKCSRDITGKVIGTGIAYFDELGKPTQSQSIDIKTRKIWMSQPIYDAQGRAMFNSSTAPKGNAFGYYTDFIKKTNGAILTRLDLEEPTVNIYEPPMLGNTEANTLGKYYSNNNDISIPGSEYQDTTEYPYARTIFSELNPGSVLKTLGGNRIDNTNDGIDNPEWIQGFSYTVPVAQEMHYVFGKDYFFNSAYNSNPNDNSVNTKFYKTVTIDVDGKESVVFTDAEGKTLAAARSGGATSYPVVSVIGAQGYVDVHIPIGINDIQLIGLASEYTVFDLRSEIELDNPSSQMTGGHFYRIVHTPNPDAKIYINGNIITESANAKGVKYKVNYYDYTLNYYDKSGKLKETVQPLGFDDSNLTGLSFNTPNHGMKSIFSYNSLGQLLETTSPDEGTAKFKYREDGQIRFSQNSVQYHANTSISETSYTNYDNLGRPIESGVVTDHVFNTLDPNTNNSFTGTRTEQHCTIYDIKDEFLADAIASNPNNFPSSPYNDAPNLVSTDNLRQLLIAEGIDDPSNPTHYQQAFVATNVSVTYTLNPETNITWYSYDIYGRVTWLVQYVHGLGIKTIDYEYDPVTSNVTKVIYQKHKPDEYFVHTYRYDDDTNQLVRVYTEESYENPNTRGGTLHAQYTYYENGALKRIQYPNQGVDYVYNLNGQLKSINHPSLEQAKDPGGDDNDLFGLSIDYYDGDYRRTNVPTPIETLSTTGVANLYNGNIKALSWRNNSLGSQTPNAQVFTYNQNNWLQNATFGSVNNATFTTSDSYKVFGIDYDKNGNIQHLNRNMLSDGNGTTNPMDRLSYNYQSNSNKLRYVDDTVVTGTEVNDLKDQSPNNYGYNNIGQLVVSHQDDVTYEYNASGLVTAINEITSNNHSLTLVESIDYEDTKTYTTTTVQNIWTVTNNAVVDIHDFSIQSDKKGLIDYCEELAKNNKKALSINNVSQNFTASRDFNASPNVINEISFDAIIKQLIDNTNNTLDDITMTVSIIENGNILQQTQYNSENTCSFYAKERLTLNFTPTTNQITFQVAVSNANSNSVETNVYLDNIHRNIFTTRPAVKFYYDDKGKRIRKEKYNYDGYSNSRDITFYIRDASGSPMAIYSNTVTENQRPRAAVLEELPVYGLSRLGVFYKQADNTTGWNGYVYQLTDHLGNVRATFANVSSGLDKRGATDYYPFGMPMPNRNIQDANGYRYAYQGQEKDPETGKEAFELRLWDGRIGRWLTTDPKGQYHSPYMGMGNNPISRVDADGGSDDSVDNPIYGSDGTFRGFDQYGWEGEAIIYDGEFTQGMNQSEIFAGGGKLFSNLTDYEMFNFMDNGWAHYQDVLQFAKDFEFLGFESGIQTVFDGKPLMTNLTIADGPLAWLRGSGFIKGVKYLRGGQRTLKTLQSTEIAAQETKKINDIYGSIRNGRKIEAIFTFSHKGKTFILDGHHRVKAALKASSSLQIMELNAQKAQQLFNNKYLEIISGLH